MHDDVSGLVVFDFAEIAEQAEFVGGQVYFFTRAFSNGRGHLCFKEKGHGHRKRLGNDLKVYIFCPLHMFD